MQVVKSLISFIYGIKTLPNGYRILLSSERDNSIAMEFRDSRKKALYLNNSRRKKVIKI